jgi:hypothetical protein
MKTLTVAGQRRNFTELPLKLLGSAYSVVCVPNHMAEPLAITNAPHTMQAWNIAA